MLARAFEPFYTTKGVGKGTGLGLAMVDGFAQQSGGAARIEGRRGEGTTVTIVLRRVPADAPAEADGESVETLPLGKGEKLLIVDDDADVRATLRHSLKSLGYEVREAEDGPGALALIHEEEPALAIVDYAMPGMTGTGSRARRGGALAEIEDRVRLGLCRHQGARARARRRANPEEAVPDRRARAAGRRDAPILNRG